MLNNLLRLNFTGNPPSKGDRINELRKKEALLNTDTMMQNNRLGILGEKTLQVHLLPYVREMEMSKIRQEQYEACERIMKNEEEAVKARQEIAALQGLKG